MICYEFLNSQGQNNDDKYINKFIYIILHTKPLKYFMKFMHLPPSTHTPNILHFYRIKFQRI